MTELCGATFVIFLKQRLSFLNKRNQGGRASGMLPSPKELWRISLNENQVLSKPTSLKRMWSLSILFHLKTEDLLCPLLTVSTVCLSQTHYCLLPSLQRRHKNSQWLLYQQQTRGMIKCRRSLRCEISSML